MTLLFVLEKAPFIFFFRDVVCTAFNWSASTLTNASAINLNPTNGINSIGAFITANNTSSPIQVDINISPFFLGCTGSSETFSITVNPTPTIDPINDTTLCSLEDLNYTFSGTTGATYNWTNDNTNIG